MCTKHYTDVSALVFFPMTLCYYYYCYYFTTLQVEKKKISKASSELTEITELIITIQVSI